ncbi:hypothetical protein [Streptomyces sp. NPDC058424]|uniref:hypothetical protein n=1 Tax=Streptomyces sp. NPDC058424 TaxID=3346491 RepID=UPI00364E2D29
MSTTRMSRQECAITILGGPAAVINIGDLRIVSDPAFDESGRAAGSAHVRRRRSAAVPGQPQPRCHGRRPRRRRRGPGPLRARAESVDLNRPARSD